MTTTSNRDEIVAGAIHIASAAEREAFIARACDGDATLKQQVEEAVAVHLRTGAPAPAASYVTEVPPPTPGAKPWLPTAALLLLVVSVLSTGAAIWAFREAGDARRQSVDAAAEREEAVKAKKEFEHLSAQAEAQRADAQRERVQAL